VLTHEVDATAFPPEDVAADAGSTVCGAVQRDPFQARTFPALSPATQKLGFVHDTDCSCPTGSSSWGWDHDDPFHMAKPPPSVATQKLGDTHAESVGPPHAPIEPANPEPRYKKASPTPSTAAQNVADAHASACNRCAPVTVAGFTHDDPFHDTTRVSLGIAKQNVGLTHDT